MKPFLDFYKNENEDSMPYKYRGLSIGSKHCYDFKDLKTFTEHLNDGFTYEENKANDEPFTLKGELVGLGQCLFEFTPKFPTELTIKIEQEINAEIFYIIRIDNENGIKYIQENYTHYGDIIRDLEYNIEIDLVRFTNKENE